MADMFCASVVIDVYIYKNAVGLVTAKKKQ